MQGDKIMNEKYKITLKSYPLEFILIATTFIITAVQKTCFSNLSYKGGLINNHFYVIEGLFWSLLLLGLLIAVLSIALISLITVIIKARKIKMVNRSKILLLLLPFLISIFFFIHTSLQRPGAIDFLQGYDKWVQKEVDIPTIQKWLASLDMTYSGRRYFKNPLPQNLPEAITKLKPQYMYFSEFDAGKRSVEFEWGGPLGHWGIKIGLPGMETPEDGHIEITEGLWEFRHPIQSGVYIFDRG